MLSPSLITISGVSAGPQPVPPSHTLLFTIIITYRPCAVHTAPTPANFPHFFSCATRLFVNISLRVCVCVLVGFHFVLCVCARARVCVFFPLLAADVCANSRSWSGSVSSARSRRKQAKPQHLKSEDEPSDLGGLSQNGRSPNGSFFRPLNE